MSFDASADQTPAPNLPDEALRALVENAQDAILLLSARGVLLYANPAFEEVFGMEPAAQIGTTAVGVVLAEDLPLLDQAMGRALSAPGERFHLPCYRIQRPDGELRYVEAYGTALTHLPEVGGVSVSVRDITDRRLAELAIRNSEQSLRELNAELEQRVAARTAVLEQTNDRLQREIAERQKAEEALHASEARLRQGLEREQEVNQLKSSFVNMVTHEFRTPLSGIFSAAEVLAGYDDRLSATRREEHLQDILASSRQMARLIDEVLMLGLVEAGRLEFNPQPIDLATLCRQTVAQVLGAHAQRCPVECSFDETLTTVCADARLLQHILTNLFSNAVKYSAPGSLVELGVVRQDEYVVFTMSDSGCGIPADDKAHLFEVFHRGSNVADQPGTGLGMVIVKRCVEAHGGDITVQSQINEGTRVTVRLPLFQQAGSAPPAA
ncbi:MAG: multi-sensor signal transduction histidine kinase [Pedosphaera sp.]|nr:multi-sensor signal transduction histidine kinase [Pedosphaera sp.]